jgi:hypothetical protein
MLPRSFAARDPRSWRVGVGEGDVLVISGLFPDDDPSKVMEIGP